jgi:hypothetical protein
MATNTAIPVEASANDATLSDAYRSFLRTAAIVLFALLLLVAGINVLVDPYAVFGAPAIDGFNAVKSRAGQQRELFKSRSLARLNPDTLILGNSRAEVGFDPRSTAWPPMNRLVFNSALAGTDLRSAAQMLSSASATTVPATILLGVDFPDFLYAPGVRPAEPIVPTLNHPRRLRASEFAVTLLSTSTTLNSLRTLASQRNADSERITERGFNPLLEYRALAAREGFHALFAQKNAEYAARLIAQQYTLYPGGDGRSPDAEQLRAILAFCKEHNVQVKMVIYPYHADFMEIIDAAGLWSSYEEWKRLLVRTVASESTADFRPELWDFSGYSSYTTEHVPAATDRATTMQWFWESGHFRPALGDIVLNDIFANGRQLGSLLDGTSIEEQHARILEERRLYRQQQPDAAAAIVDLVARQQSAVKR